MRSEVSSQGMEARVSEWPGEQQRGGGPQRQETENLDVSTLSEQNELQAFWLQSVVAGEQGRLEFGSVYRSCLLRRGASPIGGAARDLPRKFSIFPPGALGDSVTANLCVTPVCTATSRFRVRPDSLGDHNTVFPPSEASFPARTIPRLPLHHGDQRVDARREAGAHQAEPG